MVRTNFFLIFIISICYLKLFYCKRGKLLHNDLLMNTGPSCKEEPHKNSGLSCFFFFAKSDLSNARKLCPEIARKRHFLPIVPKKCTSLLKNTQEYYFTDKFGFTIFELLILYLKLWYIAIQNRILGKIVYCCQKFKFTKK